MHVYIIFVMIFVSVFVVRAFFLLKELLLLFIDYSLFIYLLINLIVYPFIKSFKYILESVRHIMHDMTSHDLLLLQQNSNSQTKQSNYPTIHLSIKLTIQGILSTGQISIYATLLHHWQKQTLLPPTRASIQTLLFIFNHSTYDRC